MNETNETKAEKKGIHQVYSNIMSLTISPHDFTLDFGYKSPEQAKVKEGGFYIVSRVSMSPSHAVTMVVLIKEMLVKYEKEVGKIPLEPNWQDRYNKAFGKM